MSTPTGDNAFLRELEHTARAELAEAETSQPDEEEASDTCNNDIVLSTSVNSGAGFADGTTDSRALPVVTSAPGQARSDHYWQGAAFAPDGTFAVSYYDRQFLCPGRGTPSTPPAVCEGGAPNVSIANDQDIYGHFLEVNGLWCAAGAVLPAAHHSVHGLSTQWCG
jgi:hypothetical protein